MYTFPHSDIAAIYDASSDDDQEFIQNLAMFLTSFLGAHLKVTFMTASCETKRDVCPMLT